MDEKLLPVMEVYGAVVQGEGALIGRGTIFVRLGLCDYRCAWCDSMFAVDPRQVKEAANYLSAGAIVERIEALRSPVRHVTLSGGNPLVHDCMSLVQTLIANDYAIAVETQGTIWRRWVNYTDLVTVSPKPPSSGMKTDWEKLEAFIRRTSATDLVLKVVVFDDADYEYARMLHQRFPFRQLYLQPGNPINTPQSASVSVLLDTLTWLSEKTLRDPIMCDAIVLPQLHVLMYGNQRGK